MSLPKQYKWLEKEGAPKMLVEALKLYGTLEFAGTPNNPVIIGWAKEVGLGAAYSGDAIPWCGLFIAVVAKRAGKQVAVDPLWADNWRKFGSPAPEAMLGDVLVFKRPGGNHVAIYVGEDNDAYHVIGGNQGDKVSITRIAKSRLKENGIRRPVYSIAQPPNVRKIILSATGGISTNES